MYSYSFFSGIGGDTVLATFGLQIMGVKLKLHFAGKSLTSPAFLNHNCSGLSTTLGRYLLCEINVFHVMKTSSPQRGLWTTPNRF